MSENADSPSSHRTPDSADDASLSPLIETIIKCCSWRFINLSKISFGKCRISIIIHTIKKFFLLAFVICHLVPGVHNLLFINIKMKDYPRYILGITFCQAWNNGRDCGVPGRRSDGRVGRTDHRMTARK